MKLQPQVDVFDRMINTLMTLSIVTGIGDNFRLGNRNRSIGTDEHRNFQGNRGTYNIKSREAQGRDINLNVEIPVIPPCHCKNDGGTNVESN